MIVDDEFLRIGSANLNNRSMGADTECDLAFEASHEQHRAFIRSVRRKLIGHFCGLSEDEIATTENDLFAFLDRPTLSEGTIMLRPIDPENVSSRALTDIIQPIADPREPLDVAAAARNAWNVNVLLALGIPVVALVGLAFAWRYMLSGTDADPGLVSGVLGPYAHSPFAPVYAIVGFIIGGLIVFPVVVLIAATAIMLGPWLGSLTAIAGVLLSALVLFLIGRVLGRRLLQSVIGARGAEIQRRIVGKGIIAVTLIRMVPVAPFSLVNLVAGASKLRLSDFLIGTALGMVPGIAAMTAIGSQIGDFAGHADASKVLLMVLTVALWMMICVSLQFVVTLLDGRRR